MIDRGNEEEPLVDRPADPGAAMIADALADAYYNGQVDLYNGLKETYERAAKKVGVTDDFQRTIDGHLKTMRSYIQATRRSMEKHGIDVSKLPVVE